jgi:FkbM family methyltransferase
MARITSFVKSLFRRTFSPALQHALRRSYLARQIARDGGNREPELAIVRRLVCPGDFALDLGANVGVYTRELSSLVGPEGQIYSFEPVSSNYEILQAVVRIARLRNVKLFHAAVGSLSGQADIVIPERGDFTGYYQAHLAVPTDNGLRECVTVYALDELWKQGLIERADFIKCDIEWGELEALRGAAELIKSLKPALFLEVSRDSSEAVFHLLKVLGYRAFVFSGALRETETYRDREFSNYFFFCAQSSIWKRVIPLIGDD